MSTQSAIALIATLPPDQAEMVMLRVVIGLDVADVAAVVGRSPGAVRVAVHRALNRLRDSLTEDALPGPPSRPQLPRRRAPAGNRYGT